MAQQIPLVPPIADELNGQQQVCSLPRPLSAPFGQTGDEFADAAKTLAAGAGHLQRQTAEGRSKVSGATADAKSQVVVSLPHFTLLACMSIIVIGRVTSRRKDFI